MRLHWWRRPVPLLSIVLCAAALTGSLLPVDRPAGPPAAVVGPRTATAQEIVPTTDPPRLAAAQVCLAADDSLSEFGPTGTDPAGDRYAAARQLLDHLAGLAVPRAPHAIAVVRFGSTAQVALPLTPITDDTTGRIRAAMQPGPPLGATDYPAAIRACATLLAGAPDPVVVVVGDGDPDVGDGRPAPALFADIAAAVEGAHGVPVHVLLAVRGGLAPATEQRWRASGVRTVADLDGTAGLRSQVARELIDILGGVIGVLPRPLGTLTVEQPELTFDIPGHTPSMTLTAFSAAGPATVRLRDPAGSVIASRTGAVIDLPVPRPSEGQWQVQLGGRGPVIVQIDVLPLQARLVAPSGDVPVGRPLTVSAEVGDDSTLSTGGPPLYVGAVVTTGGHDYELQLVPVGGARWRSVDTAPIEAAGPVTVRLLLKSGPDTVLDATTAQLQARLAPYLVADRPVVVSGGPEYGWQLEQAGSSAPDDILGEDPRAAVVFRVGTGEPQRATYRGSGRWTLDTDLLGTGGQVVTAQLSTRLLDGAVVTDSVTSTPAVVAPEPTTRWHRSVAGGLLAVLTAGAAWLGWLLVTTHRRLDGYLRDTAGRPPLRARRRRWVRTAGAGTGRVLWCRGDALVERAGLLPWPFDAVPSRMQAVPARPGVPGSGRARGRSSRYPT